MSLRVDVDANGVLSICSGQDVVATDFHVALGQSAGTIEERSLRASPWEPSVGEDAGGARKLYSCSLFDEGGFVARISVRAEPDVAWVVVETQRPLAGLATEDSFESSSVAAPAFRFPEHLRTLAVTFGLGRSGEGQIGGYWPSARCGRGVGSLPCEAFAPLVLYDGDSALAIAPASQFLTSTLRMSESFVARSLHGATDALPAGMRIETVFASGTGIPDALTRLGGALLARSGKARPSPADSVLTSSLGWWNAYGSYYTEPVRPLGENRLVDVVDRLRRASVPIAYVGLDLWYPYRAIGQAVRFAPDPRKYARGFNEIARRHGLGFVFHLSALSHDNEYGATGADPSFYREVAAELSRQGGIAAWHDWLRTQQHLTPALRSDPVGADRWFAELAAALHHEGLSLLLCMQTMGMALAATELPNAIAARTAIDYLFGQPEALDTLEGLGMGGFRNDAISLADLRRQNLLVGSILNALGLLPFHDFFLTRHHEGLGGADPRGEAVLRALSCGPVGIGDGPGMTDVDLVHTLVSSRGALLRPDHAPQPDTGSLGGDIEIYRTERVAGDARWEYIMGLNRSPRQASLSLPHDREDVVVWDVFERRVVPSMEATLDSGGVACYVLAPLRQGIAPLGLVDKLVPAPAGVVRSAEIHDGWRLETDAPGERFAFWAEQPPCVRADGSRMSLVQQQSNLWIVDVPESVSALVATRR